VYVDLDQALTIILLVLGVQSFVGLAGFGLTSLHP